MSKRNNVINIEDYRPTQCDSCGGSCRKKDLVPFAKCRYTEGEYKQITTNHYCPQCTHSLMEGVL